MKKHGIVIGVSLLLSLSLLSFLVIWEGRAESEPPVMVEFVSMPDEIFFADLCDPMILEDTVVYYTPSGKVFHADPDCASLGRAKEVRGRSLARALREKDLRPCKKCYDYL